MLANLVQESAANPGTAATINLGGAVAGRVAFLTAFGAGGACFYFMDDGAQAEWGFGTVAAGTPPTLTRGTVLGNTAGTLARLNFGSLVRVYGGPPAEAMLLRNPASGDLMFGRQALGPLAGLRNVLINPGFLVNQRGYTSGAATAAANAYTLDRWRVVTAGQAITFADAAGVRTVTAPAGGLEQVVEGLGLAGGAYALSWQGTAVATVNGSAVANGGSFTLSGGTDAVVRFSSGTVALPMLERGGLSTAFERRPPSLELLLCQRYFLPFDYRGGIYTQANAVQFLIPTPARMRAAPTFTNFATGGGSGQVGITNGTSNFQASIVANTIAAVAVLDNGVLAGLAYSGAVQGWFGAIAVAGAMSAEL